MKEKKLLVATTVKSPFQLQNARFLKFFEIIKFKEIIREHY